MSNLDAVQDKNQVFGLLAHTGTSGTAETIRVVADADGNLGVNVITGEIVASLGTVKVLEAGTQQLLGTVNYLGTVGTIVGTLANVGTVNSLGTITTITAGTIDIKPLGGVVLSGTVGIGTTATAIPASALASRKSLIVYNSGTSRVALGGSGVGTATGLPLGTADYSPSLDLGTTILYGIADTAGGTAIVLEVS